MADLDRGISADIRWLLAETGGGIAILSGNMIVRVFSGFVVPVSMSDGLMVVIEACFRGLSCAIVRTSVSSRKGCECRAGKPGLGDRWR